MKSNAFGLDIGSTTIKAVWLSREQNGFSYTASAFAPTPQGMQSESSLDHQEIAKFLKKLVVDAKISTTNVNISLPENQVFTKVIDMPVLTEKELSSAIYWEAEQYIPAALDTMTLDWSILNKPQGSGAQQKMQVLLVAAPVKLIKRYQNILELAGLSVVAIESEILSVVRSVVQSTHLPTSLVMHIGAVTTSLAIVKNGVMVFNYTVPLSGIAMTRAIGSDFGLDAAQAEEYKRAYGLADKNLGGKVGAAIDPILTEILSELKKAMAFYAEKYKNESTISQILLTGGGASLPGIDLYFAQHIGIETVIGNPWKLLATGKVPDAIQTQGAEYTVAIGLALKEYE